MGLRACFLVLVLLQIWKAELLPNEDFSSDPDSSEWTEWTDWSKCSRSCDGGVSRQVRTCMSSKCEGSAVKYKICNMESCPDSADFRENQCSSYNEYGQTEKLWKPYYHLDEPCALYCIDQNNNIELLAARAEDGTRCRPGSLEMCIDGLCQPVGCDLEIGSLKTIDSCGVCGGSDSGSSCTRAIYQWNENTNTTCSVKCGGGYKVSQPICQNMATSEIVDQQLCDISQMPQVRLLECNAGPCPPKWEAGEWSACTQSCGSGIKRRKLICVAEQNNTKTPVFNPLCKGPKPRMQESCNMQPCPAEWIAEEWSACSASCGQGTQTRNVTCKAESLQCDPAKRPSTERRCIGDSCQDKYIALYDEEPSSSAMFYKESKFHVQAEKLVSKQTLTSYPAFVPEDWGPCSVTCGEGVRRREVTCKAHLDYTGMMRKFPDSTCSGKKPAEEEACKMRPCSDTRWENMPAKEEFGDDNRESSPKVAPGLTGRRYTWVKMGFTPCTKVCLGGVQELIVNCVRDDNKVVSPYLCDSKTQPAVITQTCNDHPCPPRWNVSEYSPCSKTCGMGIRTREVNCIHEVTMSNTAMVPNNVCDQPPPTDRELCNIVDCPTEWKISNWTKCSKACGGGLKTRDVTCHQITAQNHDISHPDHMCKTSKPFTSRPCNTRSCSKNRKSSSEIVLSADRQHFSHSDAGNHDETVNLRVGGHASIYTGAKVHIRCPTKNFPKEKIIWMKGDSELHSRGRYRINKKGFLRINGLTIADNTTFTCKAGQSTGTLTITVLPSPGNFPPNSEESNKFNHQNFDPAITMGYSGNRRYENFEDFSHEGPQDEGRHHNSHSKNKLSSTPSYFSPVGATTEDVSVGNQGIKQGVGIDLLLSSSTSSGSRLTPVFFGILASLKGATENVRDHRTLTDNSAATLLDADENETLIENLFGASTLLGRISDKNSVKFEWLVGEWSACSPSCGDTGFQERETQCLVRLDNVTQKVEKSMCEDAGLPVPAGTIRNCETDACPHWIVREWQDCNTSRCFTWNTAMQKRDVICQSANGTFTPDAYCKPSEKPTSKQECYNDLCKGVWKVGEWTKCYATCEADGLRYRILQCVWYGTKKPAGTACRDQPRPPVVKSCRKLCSVDNCVDTSKYCPNVKTLHMCQTPRYQAKCCQSCKEDI